ncbi:MAG: hypothetical protein JSU75_02825 [Gammaproteobacteria bacterium]|nr:MAG: hypothetical protein JSU75_02825 [Gammaproteobacteria bacterium]
MDFDFDYDYDPDYEVKGQEKYPSDLSSGKVYGDVEVDEITRRVKGYVIDDEGSRKRVKGYIEDDGDIHVHDTDRKTCKLEKAD